MFHEPEDFWAKVDMVDRARPDLGIRSWHPLTHHCADVASVFSVLCGMPGVARSLSISGPHHAVLAARLTVIAFLHDIGKGNAAFQAKVFPVADRPPGGSGGHLSEALALLLDDDLLSLTRALLPLEQMASWCDDDGEGLARILVAAWSHHGLPVPTGGSARDAAARWQTWRWSSPEATLTSFAEAIQRWFPEAFGDAPEIKVTPALEQAFCGHLSFADWVGSNPVWFPFSLAADGDRMVFARRRAQEAVASMGVDSEASREALVRRGADFRTVFGGTFDPNPMQAALGALPIQGAPA